MSGNIKLDPSIVEKLEGHWRSRGYGWLWTIKKKKIKAYDEGDGYCVKTPYSEDHLSDLGREIEFSNEGHTMTVTLGDPAYKYRFDKIDALPKVCSPKAEYDAVTIFEAAVSMFSRHYSVFNARHVKWGKIVEDARISIGKETSKKELFQILKKLVSATDDDHVIFSGKVDGKRFFVNPGEGKTLHAYAKHIHKEHMASEDLFAELRDEVWTKDFAKLLLGASYKKAAGGAIYYGLIDGAIGFISIHSMAGFAGSERKDVKAIGKAMDRIIKDLADAKAVVVDVSLNDGGYDSVSRAIAARFTPSRTLAYSKYAGDDKTAKPQEIYITPSGKTQFLGPVYLLTSDVTVSAAEIFTLSMRALPNVTHIGSATRGSLSDMLFKRLPNKWCLSLSNEIYLDANEEHWEGAGIPPQIDIEVLSANDPQNSLMAAIRKIVDHIRSASQETRS